MGFVVRVLLLTVALLGCGGPPEFRGPGWPGRQSIGESTLLFAGWRLGPRPGEGCWGSCTSISHRVHRDGLLVSDYWFWRGPAVRGGPYSFVLQGRSESRLSAIELVQQIRGTTPVSGLGS